MPSKAKGPAGRVRGAAGVAAWRFLVEYEGTRYSGWQRQPRARTVQGELLRAASEFFGAEVEVGGAGRTDAGVHALGQVAHLRLRPAGRRPAPAQLRAGLNDLLPHDICVLDARPVPPAFHARHDALARFYLYQISTRRTAFGKPFVWWVKDSLDLARMKEACALVVGRHDFRSFCDESAPGQSSIVRVDTAYLFTSGSLVLFRIGAGHFLWKMVRRIVGALVRVGRGSLTTDEFRRLLEGEPGEVAAWTAPPAGLFLERVLYEGDAPPEAREPAFPVRRFQDL